MFENHTSEAATFQHAVTVHDWSKHDDAISSFADV